MNEFLLTRDKLMPELYMRHPAVTYSAFGPFAKHQERIQKFRETGNLKHWYRNELGKYCFPHDAGYSDCKHLGKRIISDKILKNRTYEIAKICWYDGYERALYWYQ